MSADLLKTGVLYLHNSSQISGGERSLLNLFEQLNRQEFEPHLVIPEPGDLSREAERLKIPVTYLNVPKISPLNAVRILSTIGRIAALIQSKGIRIIHSYSPRNNLLAACAGRWKGIKVIWHERNLPLKDEVDISRMFLFLPDKIMCNSEAVSRRFLKNGKTPGKVATILNGVNLEYFKPAYEAHPEPAVGMVANLNKRKGVEFFIDVAAAVAEVHPQTKFYIIGGEFPDCRGKRLAELETLALQSGLERKLLFTGYQNDVRPWLNRLDVFVHVTVKEACSRAILEAMAAGKPVVAIDDGGNPELVVQGQTGFLIDGQNKERFVEAIGLLLTDLSRRRTMGKYARTRVEKCFDVRRNAGQTQAVYRALLDNHA